MTSTLLLEIVTADGDACWRHLDRVEYQSTPADTFDEWQSGEIPVNVAHRSAPIGVVDFLECLPGSYNGALMAVAVVDAPAHLAAGLMCSPELRANAMHTVERQSYRLDRRVSASGTLTATTSILDGVGIVARTAGVTSSRIRAFAGDYRDVSDWGMMRARGVPPILERAKAAAPWNLRTSRPHKLRIHRPAGYGDELELRSAVGELRYSGWYPGVLAVRSA